MKNLTWLPLASGMLVLVLSLGLALLTTSTRNTVSEQASTENTEVEANVAEPVFSLSPAAGEYDFSSSQVYPVGVVVDSQGKSIDGVDVVISFDPGKVQIVGGKVNPTSVFSEVPLNQVDNRLGKIKFSALSFEPKPVTGVVGTFSFKVISSGEVNFTFDYTFGATTDSNMAEHGSAIDVLARVENATYMFR